ncbi:hypothetical protein [Methyloglobulus sp.]|uniref:hypothetical protein n=1 Tax=Methyloglobulus sp. TaxID=2518622 RepID=UPI0032B81988
MNKYFLTLAIGLLAGIAKTGAADPYSLPIQLDYGLIKKAVVSQLFTGQGGAAEVWNDKHNCSFLKLYNPRISGEGGQIKLMNDVQAQLGKSFAGQCIPFLAWNGALETYQKPTISADQSVLSIPVTKANAYDKEGRQLAIAQLQDLILKVAAPKLAEVKLDLNKSRGDMERTLTGFLPKENAGEIKKILSSLKFSGAEANDAGVNIKLAFDAPLKKVTPKPEAPFTEAEQKQWQANWQEWDGFLSKAINQAASETQSPELRDTLTEILLESRSAFQAGLKAQSPESGDPVRVFFTQTWQKLAPQLRTLAKQLPEVEGLRYLTFIAATDVMYELENVGAPFGLEISSDGLRRLARMVMAGKQQAKAK